MTNATAVTTDANTNATATDTNVVATNVPATTVAVTTKPAAPVVPKEPSKKSQSDAIFAAKLVERSQGLFASNKEFRAAVLSTIMSDLGVTIASAATMYNAAKKAAEMADATVALGRDPKKEKAPSTGKRGRPAKVKPDDETPAADGAAVVGSTEQVAAETVATNVEPVVGELIVEPVADAAPAADAAETVAA